MQPIKSPYFAIMEHYVPQLLAGPEARTPQPSTRPILAGAVGIFGVLGQGEWFSETDYGTIRAQVKRALADPSVKTVDLLVDSPGGSVLGLPETADVIHRANKIKPVRAFVTGIAASAAYWLASQASKVERAPFTPLSDGAKAHMQEGVNAWYGDFLSAIRRGRGVRAHAGSTFGGGRMLRAPDALVSGMVDFVSGGVL
jgi:ClpP class serine protease